MNGMEALNALSIVPVAGVFPDLELSFIDGHAWRQEWPQQQIRLATIVMSAKSDSSKSMQILAMGFMD